MANGDEQQNPYGKAAPGESAAAAQARRAKFYTRQRQIDDARAAEGDVRAQQQQAQIYGKLGRQAPQQTDTSAIDKKALGALAAVMGSRILPGMAGAMRPPGGGMRPPGTSLVPQGQPVQNLGQARPVQGRSLMQQGGGGQQQPPDFSKVGKQIEDTIVRIGQRIFGKGGNGSRSQTRSTASSSTKRALPKPKRAKTATTVVGKNAPTGRGNLAKKAQRGSVTAKPVYKNSPMKRGQNAAADSRKISKRPTKKTKKSDG